MLHRRMFAAERVWNTDHHHRRHRQVGAKMNFSLFRLEKTLLLCKVVSMYSQKTPT